MVTGANGKERPPMQGDESRVRCPQCSRDDHPVFCAAVRTATGGLFTYYKCSGCSYTLKKVNHERSRALRNREAPPDFSAR